MSDYKIPDNPFVGLRPFTGDESLLFFGRDQHVDGLTKPLSKNRFLSVVGSSGCGKSSLVRAGLIPRLKAGFMVYDRDEWKIAIMKPGAKPLDNFAKELLKTISQPCTEANIRAFVKLLYSYGVKSIIEYLSPILEDTHCNLLILVDQFEELFRFGLRADDEKRREEATYLVSLLLALADKKKCALPVYIVMTMRSDYLGDCDAFDGLPETMNRSQYLVPRLTRAQRREAIEGPVRLYGRAISPRLVDRLLNDAGAESDQLPILQHALMRTWNEAQKNPDEDLDLGHYVIIGAIKKAISQHAEEAIGDMNKEERQLTEKIFRALTSTDPNNRRIRREAHLDDLVRITNSDQDKVWKIIQKFSMEGRSFLVVDPEIPEKNPLIDITHESLIRQWQILGGWVKREADSARIYKRLAEDAEAHKKRKVIPWRSAQLHSALEWREREKPNEAWAKRYHEGFENAMNFLSKSSKHESWRFNFGTLIVALFLLTLSVAVYFFQEWGKDKIENAQIVREKARTEEVNALKLQYEQDKREVEAARAEAAEAQNDELFSANRNLRNEIAKSDSLTSVAHDRTAAAEIARQGALLEKAVAEKLRIKAQRIRNQVIALALAIKAKRQLSMRNDTLSALLAHQSWHFDNMSGNEFQNEVYDALRSSLNALTGGDGGPVVLQHSERGWIRRVAYHPLQQIIASASGDTIKIWKLPQSGNEQIIRLKASSEKIRDLAFSPDGKLLASASDDRTINFWDTKTGNFLTKLSHHERVWALAFSRSHGLFASGDADGKVLLWDLSEMSQGPVDSLSSASAVRCLAFSNADEPLLACGHEDGSLVLWQLSAVDNRPKKLATQKNHQGRINSVAFSPNGEMLATGGQDDKVVLWDLSRSKRVDTLLHNGPVNSVAFSPLENVLASGSSDNSIRLWDLDKPGSPIILNNPPSSWVFSLAFSPDGKSLVSGNSDVQIRIWTTQADVLAEQICSQVNRNLTRQEWHDFVGTDIPYGPACANFLTEKN